VILTPSTLPAFLPRGRPVAGPLDPRNVPQLMAGAIWLPGVQDTTGGGGHRTILSQATQANSLTTVAFTGDIPALTTAGNGAAVWDYAGAAFSGLRVTAPGSALQWTDRGSYAGWFKANSVSGDTRMFFSQWPEGAAPTNRIQSALTAGDNTRLSFQGSINGLSADDPTFATPDDRWKYNSSSIYDFTLWNFLVFAFDDSQANYDVAGSHRSHKLRFTVNGVFDEGTGFSAPHDGPTPETEWGAPPDGPIRAPLFASTSALAIGCTDTLGASWRGQIGPVYVADETLGVIPASVWRRVMLYSAPA
jgi:hypothetical protein